jgi:hypothetical protein
MRRELSILASVLWVGCAGGATNANTPAGDDSSDTSDVPSTHHSKTSTDSSDSGNSNPFGNDPPVSIGAIPCHVDEAAPPPAAPAKDAKPGAKPTASKEAANPPTVQQPISISPNDLAWRIDKKRLAEIYDKVIDGDFKDKYQKVQPGPDMQALDAQVQEQKDVFRRSFIDFGPTPTGIDSTSLKGEYTYNNDEAMMRITRKEKTRDFFFIKGKLWKIVDELSLGDKSQWGKDFQEAVVKISAAYGVPGRICPADMDHGRAALEVDWRDANTQVRAVDWGDKFGLIFVDLSTLANVGNLRTAKAQTSTGVDPSVQDVMHTPSQPPVKEDKKDKDKKK